MLPNEKMWVSCTDSNTMCDWICYNQIPISVSERKLRFFAVACARRIWHLMESEALRKAVSFGDEYADGRIEEEEREVIWNDCWIAKSIALRVGKPGMIDAAKSALDCINVSPQWSASFASFHACHAVSCAKCGIDRYDPLLKKQGNWEAITSTAAWKSAYEAESYAQCQLLRDIVGVPFRPLPVINDSQLRFVAEKIYNGDWASIHSLGYWLIHEGHREAAEHCFHTDFPHVKGCWVIDWLLNLVGR